MSEIKRTQVSAPPTSYLKEKARRLQHEIDLLDDYGNQISFDVLEYSFDYMRAQLTALEMEIHKLLMVAKQEVMNEARQPEAPYLGEDE